MAENETTYHIENASSGRAKCKKCKEPIAKGELRIATNAYKEGKDVKFTSYTKPNCFAVPPRALKGVSPADFVSNHLEDRTADSVLSDPVGKEEIVAAIARKPPRKGVGGGKGKKAETPVQKRVEAIKAAVEALGSDDDDDDGDDDDEETKRPAKKARKGKAKAEVEFDAEPYARAMKKVYGGMKNDDLKEAIRWNLGYGISGTKDILLLRCLDGHVNGRLSRCPTCFQGKLQLDESDAGSSIICKGYFDEETQYRIPCQYKAPASKAPRLQPWYTDEPTEEEMEAMKAVTENHISMGSGAGGGGGGAGDVPQDLMDAAKELDWPIASPKQAAQALLEMCTTGSTKVDLPQDEKKARTAIGKLLLNHRASNPDATAIEMLELIIKEFGISAAKKEAKAKQKTAVAANCTCPENAGIVQALQELGDYYFKDGNANAGMAYKKAVASLSGLDYEITEANAKGLSKGKTKVVGIGKGTSDKAYEFLTTGTIAKLEEKRAIHS